jgi:hypothetical protein
MSYFIRNNQRALSGDVPAGPSWYRAIGGISSQPRGRRLARGTAYTLGSLGDDAPAPDTLSNPTIPDPTANAEWQAKVITQLEAGVKTMQTAELQKWLQIVATVSIPLAGAIWSLILKKPLRDGT